jgi:anti-anti-sigma regulatory factor
MVSLVDVSGRLTSFETGALRDSISALLKRGHKDIILNLTALQYLDSSRSASSRAFTFR